MDKKLKIGLGILLVGAGAFMLYNQTRKKNFLSAEGGLSEDMPIEIEGMGETNETPTQEARNGYFTGQCSNGRANVIYRCRKPGTIQGTWCLGSVDLSQFVGANGNYPWGTGCPASGVVANDMVGVAFTSTVTDQFAETAVAGGD